MLMRYMWGHGVGHTYCHSDAPAAIPLSANPVTPHNIAPDVEAAPQELDQASQLNQDGEDEQDGLGMAALAKVAADTLDNLEEEELAVADLEENDEEPELEERDIQEPDSEAEDAD